MRGHGYGVTQLKRLNNSFNRAVSAGIDGAIKIWDVSSGICTGEFDDHESIAISRIAMNRRFLVSYSDQNNMLVIRDIEKGAQLLKISKFDDSLLPGFSGVQRSVYSPGKFEIGDIIADPDDPNILITSESKRIRLWDLRKCVI